MTRRGRVIIDGRKDAEWLHGDRNWFIEDPPPPPVPSASALRQAAVSYWVGFLTFTAVVFGVVALIGWLVG